MELIVSEAVLLRKGKIRALVSAVEDSSFLPYTERIMADEVFS